MSKTIFLNLCKKNGVPKENATKAWEKLKFLAEHIKNNWEDFQALDYLTPDKILKLRTCAAEKGTEYTPNEIKELLNFVSIVKKHIDRWED